MTDTQNVATYCRIRPYNPAIDTTKRLQARAADDNHIQLPSGDMYAFTKVFDTSNSTDDLFNDAVRPLLDHKVLNGIPSVFMVYGQYGSGKTYSMIGEDSTLGLLPLSLQYLLNESKVNNITLSAIECYGIRATKIEFFDLVAQLAAKQTIDSKEIVHSKDSKNTKISKFDHFDAFKSEGSRRLNASTASTVTITEHNALSIVLELQSVSGLKFENVFVLRF